MGFVDTSATGVGPERCIVGTGSVLPASAPTPPRLLARLVHKQDFERVLTTAPRLRSVHFAVHHVDVEPTVLTCPRRKTAAVELSTAPTQQSAAVVDDSGVDDPSVPALSGHWLGVVVPKRHARRSVTRNLLKRQIRSAMALHLDALRPGMWLVRLRAPYPAAQFPSAASHALRGAARRELEQLLAGVAR